MMKEENVLGVGRGEEGIQAVIVSRHPGAIGFLREEIPELFAEAPVLENAGAEDIRGTVVGGNIPLHLAAECFVVYSVGFSGAPPRGQEYNRDEMMEAGAFIEPFQVNRGLGTVCPFCGVRNWEGWHCAACGAC